ncbi:hypothetical protein SFRURICE_008053 [Spodoptera frugiperda]|nr:hypothetical protein SFRURICE_008053 [Spodoptera frugiperda]
MGRQRCTLRHVMPLNNVPTFHHLCYKSHVIGDSVLLLKNFRKNQEKPSNTLPDSEIEPETPWPAVLRLRATTEKFLKNRKKFSNTLPDPGNEPETTRPMRQSFTILLKNNS